MHILNGPDFETKVLGMSNTQDLRNKFVGRQPDFEVDVREIISLRSCCKFPKTKVAKSLYDQVSQGLTKFDVPVDRLWCFPSVGSMLDLYWETDLFFYLQVGQYESIVSIDSYFMEQLQFLELREFWIENSRYDLYSQEVLHSDIHRHKRIVHEFQKNKFKAAVAEEEKEKFKFEFVHSDVYRNLWRSDYMPQRDVVKKDPNRGSLRFENHLVVTPYQIVNHLQRKVLSSLIAELLKRQLPEELLVRAS